MKEVVIPNLETIRDEFNRLDEEFDLDGRFRRYKSTAPELLNLMKEHGLKNEDDAVRVLFIADFIVTSSEVPTSTRDDDERYLSLLETFKAGMRSRNQSSNLLMKIIALAYKIAVLIRRQDLFLGGRGLDRQTALIKIKDAYVLPYLIHAKQILGKGSCNWELAMLHAALIRNFPSKILENYKSKDIPDCESYKKLLPFIWDMLQEYKDIMDVNRNTTVVLPNVGESTSLLVLGTASDSISTWQQGQIQTKLEKRKLNDLNDLMEFLNNLDSKIKRHSLLSFIGNVETTRETIILVRDPFIAKSAPFFLIKTKATDINVTNVLNILRLRKIEHWDQLKQVTSMKHPKKQETTTQSSLEQSESQVSKQTEPIKTQSIFTKIKNAILSIFGKQPTQKSKIETEPYYPELEQDKKRPVRKKKPKRPTSIQPYHRLAYALTVTSVAEFKSFEIFDKVRESDYIIQGIIETEKPSIAPSQPKMTILKYEDEVMSVSGIDFIHKISTHISTIFSIKDSTIMPKEIFLTTQDPNEENEDNKGKKLLISHASDTERSVYIIAETFEHDITAWKEKDRKEMILSRRSLSMRTNQFLKARKNKISHFSDDVQRIFNQDLKLENMTQSSTILNP